MGAMKRAMAASLEKQMKEIEELQAFFRQPIGEGEFDFDKFKENNRKKAEEEESKKAESGSPKVVASAQTKDNQNKSQWKK